MTSPTTRNGNVTTVQTKAPVVPSKLECPESSVVVVVVVVAWVVSTGWAVVVVSVVRVSRWLEQPGVPIAATSTSVRIKILNRFIIKFRDWALTFLGIEKASKSDACIDSCSRQQDCVKERYRYF